MKNLRKNVFIVLLGVFTLNGYAKKLNITVKNNSNGNLHSRINFRDCSATTLGKWKDIKSKAEMSLAFETTQAKTKLSSYDNYFNLMMGKSSAHFHRDYTYTPSNVCVFLYFMDSENQVQEKEINVSRSKTELLIVIDQKYNVKTRTS